jgi:hypothetical protein
MSFRATDQPVSNTNDLGAEGAPRTFVWTRPQTLPVPLPPIAGKCLLSGGCRDVTGETPEHVAGLLASRSSAASGVSAMIPIIVGLQPLSYAVESIMRESPCPAPASTT